MVRFIWGYEEHTPENSVDFLNRLIKEFPFKIKTIQTDNGIEFTYKYISDETPCPFDIAFEKQVLSTNSFHLVHRGTMVRLKEATVMISDIFTIGKSSVV